MVPVKTDKTCYYCNNFSRDRLKGLHLSFTTATGEKIKLKKQPYLYTSDVLEHKW